MINRFKFLGINDDKSFCQCCGREGLQRVVWIEDTETGEIKHFGTTCATQPAKGFNVKKEIAAELRSIAWKKNEAARQAMGLYRASGGQMVHGHDKDGPFSQAADMVHWDVCFNAIWSGAQ